MRQLSEPMQPEHREWQFVEELTCPAPRFFRWHRKMVGDGEADLSGGIRLQLDFPDESQSLQTAYDDLKKFLGQAGITSSANYKVVTEYEKQKVFEAFKIIVTEDKCRIIAGDTEGIRRGIYHLEDLLLAADGPFLKFGEITRSPWIKNRISRCFFGPIKRPPLNRDELLDDVDYYPEAYLDRLAHEGINGLWLTVAFKDLCRTSITPEYGADAEKRFEKLRRTVDKCLRYGIKTYIFCIEPAAWDNDSPAILRHPELAGAIYGEKRCFCPSSPIGHQYLYEAVNIIFKSVPDLGGMINISHGERLTTCLSSVAATDNKSVDCQRCGGLPHDEVLRAALSAMEQGMHDAAPNAELISWLYMPQPAKIADWVFDIPHHVPEKVTLQFNFESGGVKEQLGKPRTGGDYWLSYIGPCKNFSRIAEAAFTSGIPLSAKIQVGCSHEVATIPFVPVPALLYRKYHAMRELGVSNVMQCWYFGNYPGVMNKTAGMLAYESFNDDEMAFLYRLAKPDWGIHSDSVVKAWEYFADGYSHYPLSNMFQYFGPMHDGIVWPLYLQPAKLPLAPTWKLEFGTSGDTIGECLENHTLDEALQLCGAMAEKWQRGVEILSGLRDKFADNSERLRDIGVAEALGLQFASGHAILRFYSLRKKLHHENGLSASASLEEMSGLVAAEISRSSAMIELCRFDSRLGFHSEAEGYKYFPAKLAWRIEQLKSLLDKDFPAAFQRLAYGMPALQQETDRHQYVCGSNTDVHCGSFHWQADCDEQNLHLTFDCNEIKNGSSDVLSISLAASAIDYPRLIIIDLKNRNTFMPSVISCSIFSQAENGKRLLVKLKVPLSVLPHYENNHLQFSVMRRHTVNGETVYERWGDQSQPTRFRLNLDLYHPANGGTLWLKEKQNIAGAIRPKELEPCIT